MRLLILILSLLSFDLSAQTGWVGKKMSAYPALTRPPMENSYSLWNDSGVTYRVNLQQISSAIQENSWDSVPTIQLVYLLGLDSLLRPVKDTNTLCEHPCVWQTDGNAPTNSTSFLGTTNSKDLIFKTKNTEAMRIDTNGNVGIGTATPNAKLGINQTDSFTYGLTVIGQVLFSGSTEYQSGLFRSYPVGGTIEIGDFSGDVNGTALTINDQSKSISIIADSTTLTGNLHVDGHIRIDGQDSVTIYAITPNNGTFRYCTNCTGNGITGRLLGYIGSAWRRFTIE